MECKSERGRVYQGEVTIVPASDFDAFGRHELSEVRIQGHTSGEWLTCTHGEIELLTSFLQEVKGRTKPFSRGVGTGLRVGFHPAGVWVHENHMKRYFGIATSNADDTLQENAPSAVPKFFHPQSAEGMWARRRSTMMSLQKAVNSLQCLSEGAREQMLRSTFRAADVNGDGVLSRREMATLLRRICPTAKHDVVMIMISEFDQNNDEKIEYQEFVNYLNRHANTSLARCLESTLLTPQDAIRATFRVWDKNGDGVISAGELRSVLKKSCSTMSDAQISLLVRHMDANLDGSIDYNEFVSFLFPGL